jgi:riboflavin kinase/FMN adenylyltransferase
MSQRTVLTIGNFDGVHIGHSAILRRARAFADERGASVHAITFDPPPIALLEPASVPPRLCTLPQRMVHLRGAGTDAVHVLPSTRDLIDLSAEAFVESLVERYSPLAVVEGPDFRFGKGRTGDHSLLKKMGQRHGFESIRVERVEVTLRDQTIAPLSSSLLRWLVGRGRVEDAARGLGRPFSIEAEVVRGEQRGRTIGVPTANLDPAALEGQAVPADGVYAGSAHWSDDTGRQHQYPAAISIGPKPTFGKRTLTVEAHLLRYTTANLANPDALYGQRIELRFHRWVRDQYLFPSIQVLREQLTRDLQQTQAYCA